MKSVTAAVTLATVTLSVPGSAFSPTTTDLQQHSHQPLWTKNSLQRRRTSHKRSPPQSSSQFSASSDSTRPPPTSNLAILSQQGRPSSPGWTRFKDMDRNVIDELTDWATSDEPNRPIICEWEPDPLWLWTRWKGTALSVTWLDILMNIALGITVDVWVRANTGDHEAFSTIVSSSSTAVDVVTSSTTWKFFWTTPPQNDPLIEQLTGLKIFWEYLLTLCSFLLAFFTSQAYSYWRSVYFTTRAIQGRINDVCMLLTMSARRSNVVDESAFTTGYDDEARRLVMTCTRLLRLSHTFFWAATPTVSDGVSENAQKQGRGKPTDVIGPVLLSPMGLEKLVDADELTPAEKKALMYSGLPPSQYSYVLLEWVGLYTMQGLRDGVLDGNFGLEDQLLKKLTDVRAEYFSIGDLTAGRMPIAYVQLVQILVDVVTWLSPISLYSGLGSLSIPLGAMLTLFFKGQLEVCKSFLDPFGVEGHPAQNIRVDVLVSELNFGATSRWTAAAECLPNYQMYSRQDDENNIDD